MKIIAALVILLALGMGAQACTITIAMNTTTPLQNFSKTWTDTDPNCVLALQAMADKYATNGTINPTPAQAALAWGQSVVNDLISMTVAFQKKTQAVTPINPQ